MKNHLRGLSSRVARLPPFPSLRPPFLTGESIVRRLPRAPLPITTTTILLLLLLPALGLQRWPRPKARGLEQLMANASLVQSFPPTPDRPVPQLWQDRFGRSLAERLWREQRLSWWQFWGEHAEAPPYLALPAGSFPGGSRARLPPQSLRVGDLVVVAPDPLTRQLLQDRLRPRLRPSRGLQRRCLSLLEKEQGVYWNPAGLGVIVGVVSPFLQRFQEGCLSLTLDPQGLAWQGEAAAIDGVQVETSLLPAGIGETVVHPPLPADLLLEVEGSSLEQLLQGLLARQLIRNPLVSTYGIDSEAMAMLRRSPFRLRLRPQVGGAFQASLELQLPVEARQRVTWRKLLVRLARALQERGLSEADSSIQGKPVAPPAGSSAPGPQGSSSPPVPGSFPTTAPPAVVPDTPTGPKTRLPRGPQDPGSSATWSREDGVVVGGWRWIQAARGESQLLLFLGPVPTALQPMGPRGAPAERDGGMLLRIRPEALERIGMLPDQMPLLVRRADQLWIEALPLRGEAAAQPISRLRGRLRVAR